MTRRRPGCDGGPAFVVCHTGKVHAQHLQRVQSQRYTRSRSLTRRRRRPSLKSPESILGRRPRHLERQPRLANSSPLQTVELSNGVLIDSGWRCCRSLTCMNSPRLGTATCSMDL